MPLQVIAMLAGRIMSGTVWISLLLALAAGPIASAPVQPRFGVAEVESDSTGCVVTNGWRLAMGDTVLIVLINPPAIAMGVVGHEIRGPCRQQGQVFGDSVFTYAVRIHPKEELEPGLGAAVVAPQMAGSVDSTGVSVRVPGRGGPYTFRYCASMEGMHITAWQGQRRVWHEYYYVGYDLEPDCTDAEVRVPVVNETGLGRRP